MSQSGKIRMVANKTQLLREFRQLAGLMADYEKLLKDLPEKPNGNGNLHDRLRLHQSMHYQARFSLGTIDLAFALLGDVLGRLKTSSLSFHGLDLTAEDGTTNPLNPSAQNPAQLIAWLSASLEGAPVGLQNPLRGVFRHVLDFFTKLQEDNVEALEGTISRLNVVTSSRQSQNMLREIILITRDIYRSLNHVSDGLPIEDLTETSGGIQEQVRRLRNVITRLDEAAQENLSVLEALMTQSNELKSDLEGALQNIRDSQITLSELKDNHPELVERLDHILEGLGNDVGAPVMGLVQFSDTTANAYMELMSNHTFQELTGKTLSRIIDFVERLEQQLFEILRQYKPDLEPGPPPPDADATVLATDEEKSEPLGGGQSQADVDRLLDDLNF